MLQKKFLKIILYYFLLVFGLILILGGYLWYLNKQKLVGLNLARPNFPYLKYSVEELEQMYPQYPNENVVTTQTPEETYAKFIQALKNGEVEKVMENFTERKKGEYWDSFTADLKNGNLSEMIDLFDREIILKDDLDSFKGYELEGFRNEFIIEFIKDSDGVWKIDSL